MVEGGERLTEVWDEKYLKISALFELQKRSINRIVMFDAPKAFTCHQLSLWSILMSLNLAVGQTIPKHLRNGEGSSKAIKKVYEKNARNIIKRFSECPKGK